MKIVIGFNYVDYVDKRRRTAQENAVKVLSLHPSLIRPISFDFENAKNHKLLEDCGIEQLNILKKDSVVIVGGDKRLPYIKEILECCYNIDCEVFGYINSDILMPSEAYDVLNLNFDSYIFSRSDIADVSVEDFCLKNTKKIYGGGSHSGADGFFFKKSWWDCNRSKFPENLIVGSTEWDTVYRLIIKKLDSRYIEARALYHVYHDQFWTTTSPSALNNIAIWNAIKKEYAFR